MATQQGADLSSQENGGTLRALQWVVRLWGGCPGKSSCDSKAQLGTGAGVPFQGEAP